MNPITLPTSPETRAALEKAGWYLLDPRAIRLERWCHDEPNANIILHDNATLPIIGDDCDFFKVLEFAAILGITIPGYRLAADGDLDVVRNLLEEADSKRQYDPSWIRPRILSAMEALDRITQAKFMIEALSPPAADQAPALQAEGRPVSFPDAPLPKPRPPVEGGPSPSPENGLSVTDLETWAEVTSQEPGLHQVNPINQRKAATTPSPLALLESLYNCAVNGARVEPELERQIRQAIGADAASGPREEE